MENKTNTNGVNGAATLFGGTDLKATLRSGEKETVKVRELPIKDIQRYMSVFEDEARTVELFCDKPEGWADTLSRGSFEAVIDLPTRKEMERAVAKAAERFIRRKIERGAAAK